MKPTLASLACLLLASVASACGGGGGGGAAPRPPAVAQAALPQIEIGSDVDDDSDSYPREPPDNEKAQFGRPASSADARSLAALVKRYYADAARGDGAAACRLLYLTRAETVASSEGNGSTPGRLGGGCAAGLSGLFRRLRGQLRADSAALRVGAVRDEFNTASVQLFFGHGRPAHYIEGHRERGAWKVGMLLDDEREIGAE